MADMSLIVCTPVNWPMLLPHVRHLAEAAVAQSDDDWNLADLDLYIMRGEMLAYIVAADGLPIAFIAGQFIHYPRCTAFLVTFAAGKLRDSVKEIDQLVALVKAGGASYVEAYCHPSRARLFRRYGFEYCRTLVRRRIE